MDLLYDSYPGESISQDRPEKLTDNILTLSLKKDPVKGWPERGNGR